ncbi:MAG: T9SS type A sorting domain-containing protein [Candidatus Azobacteroides sp.]|nr:T9SS type A sorting domain-containing protein [Candidatus Azobacteroides sp.]
MASILYPLPTDENKVYFDGTNKIIVFDKTLQNQSLTFELVDMQRRVVLRTIGLGNKNSISIANLLNGIYLYHLTKNGMVICTGKILKNN